MLLLILFTLSNEHLSEQLLTIWRRMNLWTKQVRIFSFFIYRRTILVFGCIYENIKSVNNIA